jgi:hypothetical protein
MLLDLKSTILGLKIGFNAKVKLRIQDIYLKKKYTCFLKNKI